MLEQVKVFLLIKAWVLILLIPHQRIKIFFCSTFRIVPPNIVDNIPVIQTIGTTVYSGRLNIVTETGATVTINAALSIVYRTCRDQILFAILSNLAGNIAVKSNRFTYLILVLITPDIWCYYSGFDTKPEIVTIKLELLHLHVYNVKLKISTFIL
jgi:hypothetical protein